MDSSFSGNIGGNIIIYCLSEQSITNDRLCGIPPENSISKKNLPLNLNFFCRRCCLFIFLHDFGCLPTYITTQKMRNSTKDTLQNQAGGMPSRISCALKASRFDKRKHRIGGLAAE